MSSYFSNGKLLLTSEYGVLGGAKALALPCKKGQNLEFKKIIQEFYLGKVMIIKILYGLKRLLSSLK